MLEKPDLSDEKIIACLRDNYGLSIVQVEFLPLGADMNTAVYRVTDADQTVYFLKLRLNRFDENSVLVPRFLVDQGITSIINPMSNQSGQLWMSLAAFTAILYPFVVGKSGVDFTPQQWVEFGATLHSIHSAPIPDALRQRLPVESWSGHWRDMVRIFMARVATEEFQEPVAAKLAALLNNKRPVIEDLVARAEYLAGVMQARSLPLVLCHSDIHMWNVFITPEGRFYIVDWDDPILAPKERDLMFINGGIGASWSESENIALFYQGYGQAAVDQSALAYYRYERIVQDIASYSQQLLLTDAGGADRESGLGKLANQFTPNGVITHAYRTENIPPPENQLAAL